MLRGKGHSDKAGLSISHFLLIFLVIVTTSCGKKGAPTLASYEKPSPPSQLSARHREDKINLSWAFTPEKERLVSGFVILRSSDSGFQKIGSADSGQRLFTDRDFNDGVSYRYEVVAQNFRGVLSDFSNVVVVTPAPPPPPPGEAVFDINADKTVLTWGTAGKDIFYNVYRSFQPGVYGPEPVNASPLAQNSYKDAFFMDRRVFYTIRSITKNNDEGAPSREIIVDPFDLVPPKVEDVTSFAAPDRVFLSWKGPDVPFVTGFRVYRRLGSGDYTQIGDTQVTSFVDMGEASQPRDYSITAVGPSKEGPPAEIKGVRYAP